MIKLSSKSPWYKGLCLLDLLDSLDCPERNPNGPVRLPILDKYKEVGMHALGKLESGTVKYGSSYTIMPSKQQIEVNWIFNSENNGVPYAKAGESIRVYI